MCFVCGRQNPIGLGLDFYEDHEADQVRAEFTVPDAYQGYPGVVHGGIVSTILDEVAGRAVMMDEGDDRLLATLRMTVRFRQSTPTETLLTAVGWVKQMSGIGAKVAAEIRLPDGTVTADCESLLAEPPEAFRERWEGEKPYWKVYD
jgi:acyl-coenzyme A thioesterase PaaI-like protein